MKKEDFKKWFHALRFSGVEPEVPVYRQTGRTTRLVDRYIQQLFETGTILKPKDHIDQQDCHRHLMDRIRKRLHNEHPHIFDLLKTNTKNCISFFDIN